MPLSLAVAGRAAPTAGEPFRFPGRKIIAVLDLSGAGKLGRAFFLVLFLSLVCASAGAEDVTPSDDETPAGVPGFWKIPDTRTSWIKPGGFVKCDERDDMEGTGAEDEFVG